MMSIRPLKCKFCWRRYKYEACLKHHMQQAHIGFLRLLLLQQYTKFLQKLNNDTASDKTTETESKRATVIRCTSQLE